MAYPLGAARAALTGRPLRVRVVVDDVEVFSGGSWQVMVACTGAFGGGSGIGAADATDGDLDVVILPAGSRLALVRRAWGLRAQRVERQRAVQHHEGRVVSVTLPPGTEINCDGEFRDSGLERVSARANAFELVVPERARPAVERVHPPDALLRAGNPIVRRLLTSPLHRPLSGRLLLVRYVGRRSGRRLEVPFGRIDYDGRTAVISNSPWRLNFRGGRDAELARPRRGGPGPRHADRGPGRRSRTSTSDGSASWAGRRRSAGSASASTSAARRRARSCWRRSAPAGSGSWSSSRADARPA